LILFLVCLPNQIVLFLVNPIGSLIESKQIVEKGEKMDLYERAMQPGRREFLHVLMTACPLLCLGGVGLYSAPRNKNIAQKSEGKHKFHERANMSYAQIFDFAFAGFFLPIIGNLESETGSGEYLESLKRAAEKAGKRSGRFMAKNSPEISLAAYTSVLKNPDPFWQHALTTEIVEDKEQIFEIKVTECLWATTFREAQAGDIGFATVCYQDYAMSQGFSPKLKMIRSKTLMQGHDCCNHRWVWEGGST
jgi:hypothetical protein